MQRIRIFAWPWMGLGLLACGPLGCAQYDPVTRSTMAGSGLGAVTGAIVGEGSGHPGAGALVGAAAGALGGALVGDAQQARAERDAAYAYAQNSQRQQQLAGAVTNSDVIYMARNGLGDAVIINAIQTRGGRFDTSPQSLIGLKSQGVSDDVIRVMQSSPPAAVPPAAAPIAIPPTAYMAPPPPFVVVEPPPPRPIIFGRFGPRYRWRPHRRPRSGIFIQGRF